MAVPPYDGENIGPVVGVGWTPSCGQAYTLLRFNNLDQLTFPLGYQIENAELIVVPARGYYPPNTSIGLVPIAMVDVEAAWPQSDWDPNIVNWASRPNATTKIPTWNNQDQNTLSADYEKTLYFAATWVLQDGNDGHVRNWLEGGNNYGVELRAISAEPACHEDPNWAGSLLCRFVAIPKTSQWIPDDKTRLSTIDEAWSRDHAFKAGGFALKITYTPPTLQDGVVQLSDVFPTSDPDQLDYLRVWHSYLAPTHTSWVAVGVKGLDRQLKLSSYNYVPAGILNLGAESGGTRQEYPGSTAKLNYLLLPSTADRGIDFMPPNPGDAANSNLEYYRLEARKSVPFQGNPTFTAFSPLYTHTFTMSTQELVRVIDLNLVENTTVKVKISVQSSSVTKNQLSARLYPPNEISSISSKDKYDPDRLRVNSGQSGKWALVIGYEGEDIPGTEVGSVSFQVTVVAWACPSNMNPVDSPCRCEAVEQPDPATPVKVVGPFRIYSENGFESTGTYWQNAIPTTSCKAPFIGWSSGDKERLVMVSGGHIRYITTTQQLWGPNDSIVSLVKFTGGVPDQPPLDLLKYSNFEGYYQDALDPDYGKLVPTSAAIYMNLPLQEDDAPGASLKINVRQDVTHKQRAEGAVTLSRPLELSPAVGVQTLVFNLTWDVQTEGYATTLNHQVTRSGAAIQLMSLA